MKYEPQTSYASKIDEDRRFATAQEAAAYDRDRAIAYCSNSFENQYHSVLGGRGPNDLRRSILYLADLIREGEAPARECTCHPDDNPPRPCPQKFAYSECVTARPEPTQEDFFKAYERAFVACAPVKIAIIVDSLRYDIRNKLPVVVTDAMVTAWRAIGLDGEPTAERIRALRETKP